MATGDNFEESIMKFGDFDSSNNEDFDHSGESITQHGNSYEFQFTDNGEKNCTLSIHLVLVIHEV
jgi:hypothetical protein